MKESALETTPVTDTKTLIAQTLGARGNPLWALLRYRILATRNYIATVRNESLLKVVVVTTLGLAFWFGLFALAMVSFRWAESGMGQFRTHLVPPILSLFFLAITFMLVFSNAVISFSSLFKAPETAFLFALPLRHDTIFLYKLFESLIFSSWAIFAAGLPLMIAYGIQFGAQWWYYPLVGVFMVPFVMLPAGLGSLLGLVLTAILPRRRGMILFLLGIVLFVGGVYVGMLILNSNTRARGGQEVDAAVASVLSKLSFTRHPLTPNYWMSEAMIGLGEGRAGWVRSSSIFFAALASSAMFAMTLGWFVSGSIYETAYSISSGGGSVRKLAGQSRVEWLFSPLMAHHPQVIILLVKDIKTFLRDPAQWSQVLIFFGILVLYIGNLRNFSYPLGEVFYQNLISFLNLGATCMTLATMTSRFIFPMISLEGHRFWILGLLPIQRRDVMMSKFYFSLGGALLLTLSLVTLSNYILRGTTYQFGIQIVTAILLSLSLSGLSVGMGAIFPSFNERNPSKIVSGFGGTLTLIIAIGLVVFSVLGEALICHRFLVTNQFEEGANFESQYGYVFYLVMAGVAACNILAAYLPMRLGIKALENVEF